jgi:catechol 2,3-dioxygenase-like lactoylglutathione lyase family enzyme
MAVEGFDHVAITVADVDATIAWYARVLGAVHLYPDVWQSGAMPVALMQVGASRLSIHPASSPAAPHAPTPGSADLCFRYSGAVGEILSLLESHRVDVVEGPVPRPASSGEWGTSVYFRDPDGNLIELLTVSPPSVVNGGR